MKPTIHSQLYETPISTHWFDEDGIMYATSKREERKIEHYKKVMELYATFSKGGKKICLLADATNSMEMSAEVKEYLTTEMPKYIAAQAIISDVEFKSSQISTFLKLSWVGFPVMKFSTEKEAKEWLKQYL